MLAFLKQLNRKYNIYYFFKHPFLWFYAAYLTLRFVDEYDAFPAIRFSGYIPVRIKKHKNAKFILRKNLLIDPWLNSKGDLSITIRPGAVLFIEREFSLGNNIKILVSDNARLEIGGREAESGSGITANAVVMVNNHLAIGKDCIIAWDTFITDCDWHSIDGKPATQATSLGTHVWVGAGSKVLKGCVIGDNSIVASNSVVLQGNYPERTLLGGSPAKIIRQGIPDWHRDMN